MNPSALHRIVHLRILRSRIVQPRTVRLLAAFVLASLLCSSLAQRYFGHAMAVPNIDFYDYYFAAQAVRDHPRANLYEGATGGNPQLTSAPAQSALAAEARAAGIQDTELYLYPPLLADLLTPFAHLPAHMAAALWRALNLALVLLAMALLAPLLRVRLLSGEFALLAAAAYWFWPVHEAVSDGQVTIVLLALWAFAVTAYARGRVALSALALATALKVTPLAILPLFLLWKERRWLAMYFSTLLGLTALMAAGNGPENLRLFAVAIGAMGQGIPALANKSLTSLTAWIFYGKVFTLSTARAAMGGSPWLLRLAAKALSGAFFLGCLVLVWRARRRMDPSAKAVVLAVFALVLCCIAPVSWRHGYTVALLPLAMLWARALRRPPRALHLGLLTLTTFTQGSLFFDLAAAAPIPGWAQIVCASLWIVLSCALCLDTLYAMQSEETPVLVENSGA